MANTNCSHSLMHTQVCIEALSVSLRQQTLDAASRNLGKLDSVGLMSRVDLGMGSGLVLTCPPQPALLG